MTNVDVQYSYKLYCHLFLSFGCLKFLTNFSLCDSPELRKGKVSNRSLSPSGPGAAVPRSNRDVPLPDSGRRGNSDCIAFETERGVRFVEETG